MPGSPTHYLPTLRLALVVSALCIVTGSLLVAAAMERLAKETEFAQRAWPALAVVVAFDAGPSGVDPILEFRTETGDPVRMKLDMAAHAYAIGDYAPVLYDPANPRRAVLNDFSRLWALSSLLGLTGLLLVAVPTYAILEDLVRHSRMTRAPF